jgi:mono/diheme cytochrome c family protein
MRTRTAWAILVFVVVVTVIVIALMSFNLTAMQEPGRFETFVANRATRCIIRRASRQGIPPRPQDTSISSGGTLYGSDCSQCHGSDGHAQTPIGRWMYPRAADLTSKQVQSYSDQELFWIVQNGIRFTGMPAFGKVETGDNIWNLVNYVRILRGDLRSKDSTK